ncbi:ZP domain-containing protein-like [Glandiceps talaboti]
MFKELVLLAVVFAATCSVGRFSENTVAYVETWNGNQEKHEMVRKREDDSDAVTCDGSSMTFALPMDTLLDEYGLDSDNVAGLQLSEKCTGSVDDDNFVITTNLYDCGTTIVEETAVNISYNNIVYRESGSELFEITCVYPLVYDVKVKIIANPCHLLAHFLGFGTFSVEATLYRDESFTTILDPNTDFPVEVCDGSLVYFGISVDNEDNMVAEGIKSCVLSDSSGPGVSNTFQVLLVSSNCPVSDHVSEIAADSDSEKRYSMGIYELVNWGILPEEDVELYVHCVVDLCQKGQAGSLCSTDCNGSSEYRRDVSDIMSEETETIISHGPFTSPGERCNKS